MALLPQQIPMSTGGMDSGLALRAPRNDDSRRKPEMHHVAVGDDVILAFQPQLAGVTRAGFAAERDVVVVGDRLAADEAALEIGVDDAGRLRRPGAAINGPGARFLRPDGE